MKVINRKRQLAKLTEYFRTHETDPGDVRIGAEFEHFLTDANTLETLDYFAPNGGAVLLDELAHHSGWRAVYEEGYILGLQKNGTSVTLEPGGQIEFSTRPRRSVEDLRNDYDKFLAEVLPFTEKRGTRLVCLGYQPKTPIDGIRMIPRKKYHLMAEYFAGKGKYSRHMMKGTAAIQTAVDYTDEQDFREKLQTAYLIGPAISVLFDNSLTFEGGRYSGHSLRTDIWSNCDTARCGIIPGVLSRNFGYEDYAAYILDTEPIVLNLDGVYRATGNDRFGDLFDPEIMGTAEIEQVLLMVFPDVRAKGYLEIRSVDSQPYRDVYSFLYCIERILYVPEVREEILRRCGEISETGLLDIRRDSVLRGMQADFPGGTIADFCGQLIDMLRRTAFGADLEYIAALERILLEKTGRIPVSPEERLRRGIITPETLLTNHRCPELCAYG